MAYYEHLKKILTNSIFIKQKEIDVENNELSLSNVETTDDESFIEFSLNASKKYIDTTIVGSAISSTGQQNNIILASIFESNNNCNDITTNKYSFYREEFKFITDFYIINRLFTTRKVIDYNALNNRYIASLNQLKLLECRIGIAKEETKESYMFQVIESIANWKSFPNFLGKEYPKDDAELNNILAYLSMAERTEDFCKKLH